MKKLLITLLILVSGLIASQCVAGQTAFNTTDIAVVDTLLPDVPIGLDPHAFFFDFMVYVATILMITQALKKLLKFTDKKALILSFGVGAVVTFIGYYFKLGMLGVYEWWGSLIWYVGFIAGAMLGYDKIKAILKHFGFAKK